MNRPAKKIYDFIDNSMGTHISSTLQSWIVDFHNNNYKFSPEAIAIIHIPKTGGTSLKYILENLCCSYKFVNLDKHSPISVKCPPDFNRFRYITFLRNPINRCYSYYQMSKRDSRIPYHKYSRDIKIFFENCWEVRNQACRYISGRMKEPDDQSFVKASKNIDKMYFVGLFEDFENQVQHLVDKLNTNQINNSESLKSSYDHLNQWNYDTINSEIIDLIKDYNFYDIKLYNLFVEKYFPSKHDLLIR